MDPIQRAVELISNSVERLMQAMIMPRDKIWHKFMRRETRHLLFLALRLFIKIRAMYCFRVLNMLSCKWHKLAERKNNARNGRDKECQ